MSRVRPRRREHRQLNPTPRRLERNDSNPDLRTSDSSSETSGADQSHDEGDSPGPPSTPLGRSAHRDEYSSSM